MNFAVKENNVREPANMYIEFNDVCELTNPRSVRGRLCLGLEASGTYVGWSMMKCDYSGKRWRRYYRDCTFML